jgi:hypothetical protein
MHVGAAVSPYPSHIKKNTTMAVNAQHTKPHLGFYAFMGLMLAGFVGILGFVIYLMFQ